LPFALDIWIVSGDVEKTGNTRLGRLTDQFHPSFLWCPACLTPIAGYAGTDNILPGMLPAPVTRDNMVKGKVTGYLTTILAGILVTFEYFKSGHLPDRPMWTLNHSRQADYRRYREFIVDRMNKT